LDAAFIVGDREREEEPLRLHPCRLESPTSSSEFAGRGLDGPAHAADEPRS
jgi:hypothetical protein